jgi:hypothetical protein
MPSTPNSRAYFNELTARAFAAFLERDDRAYEAACAEIEAYRARGRK